MRKLIYSMGVSLDGFIAGPGGEIDWSAPDEELHRFHNRQTRELGAHLCGRRLLLTEGPGWIAFALEDGVVYHTYTRMAPDRDFVVPYYHQLLDRTPKGRRDGFRAWRHDEYEDSAGAGSS